MEAEGAEKIRRREVRRALRGVRLSSEEEEAVERMSYSLVERLIRGPIPRAMGRTGGGASEGRVGDPRP